MNSLGLEFLDDDVHIIDLQACINGTRVSSVGHVYVLGDRERIEEQLISHLQARICWYGNISVIDLKQYKRASAPKKIK